MDEAAAALMGINHTDAQLLDILEQHGRTSAGALATHASLTPEASAAVASDQGPTLDALHEQPSAVRTGPGITVQLHPGPPWD
jgi:hypothetical protein